MSEAGRTILIAVRVRMAGMLLALLFSCWHCEAAKTDSLRAIFTSASTDDTSKVRAYAAMAWEYKNRHSDADSILYYANKGLALANKAEFERGKALCYLYIGVAYVLKNDYGPGLLNLDNALAYFEAQQPGKDLNEVYHNLGLAYYLQTKWEPAITYFEKSKKVAATIKNNSRLARAYFYLGDIYNDMGSFANALQEYLKALELYEAGGNKNSASNCLTNIATLYAQLKDYKKAQEFVDKSLVGFSESANPQEVYQNYSNIGIVYSMMGEYDKALDLFNKGMKLTDSLGDQYWNTVFLTNIAEVYTSSNKPDQAVATYKKVLERNEKAQEVNFTIAAHSGMGRILYKQGKKQEGIAQLLEALRLMKENSLKRLVMETAADLSAIYEKEGDYRKALEYDRLSDVYKDSIFNEKNDKKIQQLQFDYELDKKQRQIQQLNRSKEIQAIYTNRLKIVAGILVAGTLLMIGILVLFYRKRSSERRAKEEVQVQAAKLEELNQFKDKTFSVLSHDLRGPINSVTATMQMLNDKHISPEEYATLQPEINAQMASLNLLLDNVLLWAKSYIKEEKAAHPAATSLLTLVNQNLVLLQDTADRKEITMSNNVNETAMAYCDAGQINIVIRNLIMNAIKYTEKGGHITIGSETVADKTSLWVKDNGVGMNKEQVDRLFTTKAGRNTYGTEGEKGIGLGLLICNEFVKVNNGDLAAISAPGKGTTFSMTLPRA